MNGTASGDTPLLTIRLLGTFRLETGASPPVEVPRGQTATLLALLALRLPHNFSRDELVALLWPDDDVEQSRGRLRQVLYRLNKQLDQLPDPAGCLLIANRTWVGLDPVRTRSDTQQFEAALSRIGAVDSLQRLEEAASLYGGELLPGYYEDRIIVERNRLSRAYSSALERLIRGHVSEGDLARAARWAQQLVAADPLAEEAHLELIRIYVAQGEGAAALRQYREMERMVREELDAEPSAEARALLHSLRSSTLGGPQRAGGDPAVPPARLLQVDSDTSSSHAASPAFRPVHTLWRRTLVAASVGVLMAIGGVVWKAAFRAPAVPSRGSDEAVVPISQPLWSWRYEPKPGDRDSEPTAIKLDRDGFIYVAGFLQTLARDVDFLVLKLDPRGRLIWQVTHDGPASDVDRARSLAVDEAGNVYVAGDSLGKRGNGRYRLSELDYSVVKYRPSGGPRAWERRYDGPSNGRDVPVRVVWQPGTRRIIVTGTSVGTTEQDSVIATVWYDANGRRERVERWAPKGCISVVSDMVALPDGGVCVAGTSRTSSESICDSVLLRYSAQGDLLWVKRYPWWRDKRRRGPRLSGADGDIALAVETPPAEGGGASSHQMLALRINSDGQELFRASYSPPPGSIAVPAGVGAYSRPYTSVVMEQIDSQNRSDLVVLMVAEGGQIAWAFDTRRLGPTSFVPVAITDIGYNDHFAVTGRLSRPGSTTGDDSLTMRFNIGSGLEWAGSMDGGASRGDGGRAIATGQLSEAVVAAQSDSRTTRDILVLGFGTPPKPGSLVPSASR